MWKQWGSKGDSGFNMAAGVLMVHNPIVYGTLHWYLVQFGFWFKAQVSSQEKCLIEKGMYGYMYSTSIYIIGYSPTTITGVLLQVVIAV